MRISIKLAAIAIIVVLLTVPLLLVVSKIYERDNYADQATADIASSWTGEQMIMGPILVVPYVREYEVRVLDSDLKEQITNIERANEQVFILPDTLDSRIDLKTEVRYRGIYEVPVYESRVELAGSISTAKIKQLESRLDVVAIGKPYLSIVVSDMRGITEPPQLEWDTESTKFLPGSDLSFQPNGIHAPLPGIKEDESGAHDFAVSLALRGMSSFRFTPVGDSNLTSITSSWPHPRFDGLYLPTEREITDTGFTASWQMSAFATNITRKAEQCAAGNCGEFVNSAFGVQLVDPVDVYLQAQRASKYGILFVGLTFLAFFLFEVLKQLSIHPVQYALVGLALTVFYLLLVSLAEHIPFAIAYAIATAACSGLLAFYITHVLKSRRRGCAFGAAIAGLYGILYVIIQEEDFAFSMGAGLVFVALSGVMYFTRQIDWFDLGRTTLANCAGQKDANT